MTKRWLPGYAQVILGYQALSLEEFLEEFRTAIAEIGLGNITAMSWFSGAPLESERRELSDVYGGERPKYVTGKSLLIVHKPAAMATAPKDNNFGIFSTPLYWQYRDGRQKPMKLMEAQQVTDLVIDQLGPERIRFIGHVDLQTEQGIWSAKPLPTMLIVYETIGELRTVKIPKRADLKEEVDDFAFLDDDAEGEDGGS